MRLAALVESESHVCCRYRLAAFRPSLLTAGHTLDVLPLPRSLVGRLSLGRNLGSYDAVILQRKLLPRWAIALLRRRVRRMIFDFDDAVWLRDSYSEKGFDDPKRAARFRATVQACDHVIAGNKYLAAEAGRFTNPSRVCVLPTCIDVARYRPVDNFRDRRPGITLVWVGSSSTLQGLERFVPTLSAIGRAVPGTRLKLICDRFIKVQELEVEQCVWSEATEAEEIASADIGIGWVPDDPWSRGKCGLKILQYQAAGLPVVANPVGVQVDFVRAGSTGFHAGTTGEWVDAIRALAADPELRKRLGIAARKRVEAEFSVAAGAKLWLRVINQFSYTSRKAG